MSVDRLVFVSISEVLGGGELYLLHTAEAASKSTAVAVAAAPGTPIVSAAQARGLQVLELPLGRKLGTRTALRNLFHYPLARRRLAAFLDDFAAGEWALLQYKWETLLWGGREVPDRVAIWEHGPIPSRLLRLRWARNRLGRAFRAAAGLFAWSRPARDALVALCGREPTMLEAGVDPERLAVASSNREAMRRRYGVSGDESLLAFAGRLVADKGVFELVRLLPALPRARAVLCGAGPARAGLAAEAAQLGVDDRVHFAGFVDDPLPYLAAADATVLLSRSPGEGRPLTVVESSALGTPVLGLEGSAAMEALAREGRAHLVSTARPETVVSSLERLLEAGRVPVPTPTWDDAAETFLRTLKGDG